MARPEPQKMLPLEGLRVINLGWYWVCAVITHILADMGAEVIKVDSRQRLEVLKSLAPFLDGVEDPNYALWPHNLSRNNLGVTLNLDTAEGRRLLRDLIAQTDVVAENWTPGTMAKLGLEYAALREVRPDLIMISATAAGQSGPLSQIHTYGNVLSSLSGLDALNGYEGERPLNMGPISDPLGGVMGAFAVLAALRHRDATGEGRYIDFPEWEGMATMLAPQVLDHVWNGRLQGPSGNRDPLFVPHNVYPCRGEDSWVAIAVYTEDEWRGLLRAMGQPRWAGGPRFADKFRRKRHEADLDALIARWTRRRDHEEAAWTLQREGVAATPAASARGLYTDPHWIARDAWLERSHPLGREVIYGIHWKLSETPGSVRLDAPLIGQHNDYVFGEVLGVAAAELRRLEEARVTY